MAILIVEDNPTNGLILRHLTKKAYAGETVVVEDPMTALKLCQTQRFDLLMVDQMLPGMTGVQFVRLVRHIENFRDTPVVMVTADTSKHLRQEALSAGVDTFLTKPVEALSFARLLDELITAGARFEAAHA